MFDPNIVETIGRSTKVIDLNTKFLQERIVHLHGEVTSESANSVIKQLLWLKSNTTDKKEDINLYINSPGGSVYQGLAIKDVIDLLDADGIKVNTLGMGFCASMGAYLLSSGTGTRKATKRCRIMLHSVSSGTSGTIHDMNVDFYETKFLNDELMEEIAGFTNGSLSTENVRSMCQRDYYISAKSAASMNLIDAVV